ncbi:MULTISPECIES: metal ABC transporter ATP-binding protein [unclassified Synechococcus]|uniref:metal ABC transporter ATP-binding protein n=1 Tax=unclassified Synechococcus TaxID=2626047 RepID=UPI001C217A2C|nr:MULTISPECIES: metal ABC transporter ATP-binding protein [unclassified Synechococcus]
MAEMVLEVSHLSVRREGVMAVDDVSFQLLAESDTALVGPNGAGKSTLVQAILGILPRQAGQVRFLGCSLGSHGQLPRELRARLAYLPQTLIPRGRFPLTVAEFVGLGWDPPGLALPWLGREARRSAVREALRKTLCADLADRLLSELSGGQLKRVLLASCVVRPRRLLVLDEAQAGLDARAAEQFHTLLYQLRRSEGWTILQVSHDLEMVRRTCDAVLCLNRSLRCHGTPDHALSPSRLEQIYGLGFVPYHHRHPAQRPAPPEDAPPG